MAFVSCSVDDTRAFGARCAHQARAGDIYGLCGDLGSGKTEFVRGFVAALNPAARVQSPSFSLLNIYAAPSFPIYHFDFYRLKEGRELEEIGFDEYLRGDGVCCIEWADRFRELLPPGTRFLVFTDSGGQTRSIEEMPC